MRKFLFLFLIMGLTNLSLANFNKAGRTSLQFLKIGIGARQVALGEACIANQNDINTVFWNPAALSSIDGIETSFSYIKWIGDINIASGTIGYNFGTVGSVALSYIGLNYGDIQEALVTSPTGNADTRTGNTFSGNDLAVGLTLARYFTDHLSIGINIKYIREELFTYSSSLWSFDIGTYYETGWKGIRLAMSAQNFSKDARWLHTLEESQQSFEIPIVYRIGWSIDLMGNEDFFLGGNPEEHHISLNMDAIHTNDYAERLHMGVEYLLWGQFALRGGYRFNHEEGNLSMGGGINYDTGFVKLKIDYAYVDYDFLDYTHRFTITMNF